MFILDCSIELFTCFFPTEMHLWKDGADDDICNRSTIHEVIKDGKQLLARIFFFMFLDFFFNRGTHSCVSIETGNGVTVKMPIKMCLYTNTTTWIYICITLHLVI